MLNDEVERFLFGTIDNTGATAVRAFAKNDLQVMHNHFQEFFEYLDAQKLRTPKGLDWIQARYASLTQLDLMLEMQQLRRMHCTMWFECVREIVSAEKSDVKFIATDHPVTIYNSACPPTSAASQYPDEPSIGLIGTQTVFALDADHCLILSNLEYAQDPTGVDLLAPRQNARYAGQTITRTDALIRQRELASDEVIAINSLLKLRSRQYIAAYEETWLFPEKIGPIRWEEIGKVLQPTKDGLWHFGGEIYVGYQDGSTHFQDAFGRTDTRHKFLNKKDPVADPSLNDKCGCGSGRRFKRCCRGIAVEERPPWDVYSIRERNQIFCNAVIDILGLNKEKTWEDVRRELSDDQVKRIHEMIELLWPNDTNIAELLPRPDSRIFRTVYMGLVDPRTIAASVISSLAYFDEIIVLNPFPNPAYMTPEYSPTKSPGQHKSQLLKNVSVLLSLIPFIEAGIVHLVPDPMEFNADFRRAIMSAIQERTTNWKPKKEEIRQAQALAKDDFERNILRLPEDSLRRKVLSSQPDITPELLESTIEFMKEKLLSDPLALLQPLQAGKDDGELQIFRGISLELGLFLAHLTGSAIYTDDPATWRQLHEHTSAAENAGQPLSRDALAERLKSLTFTIEVNPQINLETRNAGKLGRVRRVFRQIWNLALTQNNGKSIDEREKKLIIDLDRAFVKAGTEWSTCGTMAGPSTRFKRRIEPSAPAKGFSVNSVRRLLITFGREKHLVSVPIALFLTLEGVEDEISAQQA
jgi:hypothetical protein